ncbi:unnamed protein product [Arctia plantaginis]|uniref:Uncharacterized protein n=1 Tax=Arctia plantaginis TaxID=874455 RepID=A0A8S0Z3S7_ARCPL|nr:unnamed protein product [Arctia plantaginis]
MTFGESDQAEAGPGGGPIEDEDEVEEECLENCAKSCPPPIKNLCASNRFDNLHAELNQQNRLVYEITTRSSDVCSL